MTTGKAIALTRQTFVSKVMSLLLIYHLDFIMGFPCSSVSKESASNAGDPGSIPVLGRCPGEENGNQLQYSSLENPMDSGAWQATVYGVPKVLRLSN